MADGGPIYGRRKHINKQKDSEVCAVRVTSLPLLGEATCRVEVHRFSLSSAPVSAHTSPLLIAFSMPDFNRVVAYNL